jgi:SAM-dependent methyltransferase
MTDVADAQASLEAVLKDEIIRMYQEVADNPDGEFHFFHGREAAELFDYAPEWLDRAPPGAVASFAGVGNPHQRSNLQPGETVPDGSVDVVLSNGVINLSFRKRRVVEEMFRVLRPGGRISITDIVSAKQLSQSIVNDPKLWASWIGGALQEGEMFKLLEESGFTRVRSAVVPRFRFRKAATQNSAEAFGIKAVMMTALKPGEN